MLPPATMYKYQIDAPYPSIKRISVWYFSSISPLWSSKIKPRMCPSLAKTQAGPTLKDDIFEIYRLIWMASLKPQTEFVMMLFVLTLPGCSHKLRVVILLSLVFLLFLLFDVCGSRKCPGQQWQILMTIVIHSLSPRPHVLYGKVWYVLFIELHWIVFLFIAWDNFQDRMVWNCTVLYLRAFWRQRVQIPNTSSQ